MTFSLRLAAITDGVVAGMNKLDIAGNKLSLSRVPTSSAAMLLKPSAASPQAAAVDATTGTVCQSLSYIHTYIQTIMQTSVCDSQLPRA